jgi:hypothetical protein
LSVQSSTKSRTDFDTVEKDPETGQSFTRRVSKEGPTGLITTGVRYVEIQTSTRILAITISDDPEQTRKILKAEAAIASGQASAPSAALIAVFQDFQRWLAAQPSPTVVVPFAPILAEKIPVREIRIRRDFKQLHSVVKAIALLNRHHRSLDYLGRIVADVADYGWARKLLVSVFKSIVSGGVTDAIRQTVDAVPDDGSDVSEADLVRALKLSKSTVNYRVNRALWGGWLRNLESRSGHPLRLVRGVPLPADDSPLPTVEELKADPQFEHRPYSNGYSNGPQTPRGVRQNEQAFECSNENQTHTGGVHVSASGATGRNGTNPSADGIPSMITNWMKTCLCHLKYTDEQIAKIKPLQAHEIIWAELRDRGYSDAEIREMNPQKKVDAILAERFGAPDDEESTR